MTSRVSSVLRNQWPIMVVLAGMVAGLAVAASGNFRRGTVLLAASVVFAAWLRVMLPSDRVGILAVRGKTVDVLSLAFFGLGLTVLALVVPAPG